MDPSYNNGNGANSGGQPGGVFSRNDAGAGLAGNVPDTKPGVIASGPDPEDVPSTPITIPAASEDSSRSKISYLLGKRDRNPSGGRVNTPSMVSMGPQPMQLSDDSKKPKRALIFGGVVVIVLLIVGLIVGLVMKGGNGVGGNTNLAFNKLINYITNGEELESNIDNNYDAMTSYYFEDGWDSAEQNGQIYDETKILVDSFVTKYKDGENEILNSSVRLIKEQFDFMYAMNLKDKIYSAAATAMIIKDGSSKAKQNLVNNFVFPGLDDNSYVNNFKKVYNEWVDALISNVKIYEDSGCTENNNINTECMTIKNDEDINRALAETSGMVTDLSRKVINYYDLTDDFVERVYFINNLLYGRLATEDEATEDEMVEDDSNE